MGLSNGNVIFGGCPDVVESGTVSAGSAQSAMPANNVKTRQRTSIWRSSTTNVQDHWLWATGFSEVINFQALVDHHAEYVRFVSGVTANLDALKLDGSSGYISVATAPSVGSDGFTVEAWIRIDGGEGTARTIVEGGNVSVGTGFKLYIDTDDYLKFRTQSDGAVSSVTATSSRKLLTSANWVHVAGSVTGSRPLVYILGLLCGSYVGSPPASGSYDTGGTLTIGRNRNAASSYFNGAIRAVRLWDTERTEAEIQGSMFSIFASTRTGLVGNWQIDEAAGTTINDTFSGVAQNGTANGTVVWINGVLEGLYTFDHGDEDGIVAGLDSGWIAAPNAGIGPSAEGLQSTWWLSPVAVDSAIGDAAVYLFQGEEEYADAGRYIAGRGIWPTYNMNFGWTIKREDPSVTVRSVGGQSWSDLRPTYRVVTMMLENLTQDEAILDAPFGGTPDSILAALHEAKGATGNLALVLFPDNDEIEMIYCRMRNLHEIANLHHDSYAVTLEFEELL